MALQMSDCCAKPLFDRVNSALALASDWFSTNKLTLHTSKNKYIYLVQGGTLSQKQDFIIEWRME